MSDAKDMTEQVERPGLWRRVRDAVSAWLRSGSCRACKGHEEDVERWRKTLDERYEDEAKDQGRSGSGD